MNALLGGAVTSGANILKTLTTKLHFTGGVQHRLLSDLELVPATVRAAIGKRSPHRVPGGCPPGPRCGAFEPIGNILRINPRNHHRLPEGHGNARVDAKRHETACVFAILVGPGIKPVSIPRPQRHPRQMPAGALLQQCARTVTISHRHRIGHRHHRRRQRTAHHDAHNNTHPVREHPRKPAYGHDPRVHHLRNHRRQQAHGVIPGKIRHPWRSVKTRPQQPADTAPHRRAPGDGEDDALRQSRHLLHTHRHLEKPAREQQNHKRHQPR